MIELKDQMNRTIRLEHFPERIVSLVPSQTELLFDLGLNDRVVGITKFCIHPDEWFQSKRRVGGTKKVNHNGIAALKPDLIIGNKEENSEADIDLLSKEYPVYMSNIYTVEDALQMIADVGTMTNNSEAANAMTMKIRSDFNDFPQIKGSVLYLIWANPWMAVGNNTFIGDIILRIGLKNILDDNTLRYIELTDEQMAELNPDYIFLSTEPFPFKQEHADQLSKITKSKIIFVDGEMFSWYGSRMQEMKPYFTKLEKELVSSN